MMIVVCFKRYTYRVDYFFRKRTKILFLTLSALEIFSNSFSCPLKQKLLGNLNLLSVSVCDIVKEQLNKCRPQYQKVNLDYRIGEMIVSTAFISFW